MPRRRALVETCPPGAVLYFSAVSCACAAVRLFAMAHIRGLLLCGMLFLFRLFLLCLLAACLYLESSSVLFHDLLVGFSGVIRAFMFAHVCELYC